MIVSNPNSLKRPEKYCSICHAEIKEGDAYAHDIRLLCEDCYMNIRTQYARKTHWQYLRSIKTEYLTPGKKAS